MSGILKVDQIQLRDGSTPSAADLGIDISGTVLQVANTISKTGSQHTTTTAYTDTNMTVTITPKAIGSKLLISFGFAYGNTTNAGNDVRLKKIVNGVTTYQTITDSTSHDNPLSNVSLQNSAWQAIWHFETVLEDFSNSLDPITFTVVVSPTAGTLNIGNRNAYNLDCNSAHYITVTEIAQ